MLVGSIPPPLRIRRWLQLEVESALSGACSPPEEFLLSSVRFATSIGTPTPARGSRTHRSLTGLTMFRQNLSFVLSPLSPDHRHVKRRLRAMQGPRTAATAWAVIQGIEAAQMIRKGQVLGISRQNLHGQACVYGSLLGIK
jgi:hypothetical protein